MSDLEKARAQAEALDSVSRSSSADRAKLWASLNRYLATEAEEEHQAGSREPAHGEPAREQPRSAAE